MNTAIELAERGLVPDFVLRKGIQGLLRKRLKDEQAESIETKRQNLINFIRSLEEGPIALETEAANDQHYEVPAEFFEIALGAHLKYSSCYWDDSTKNLDEAEKRALEITCEHAGIEDGMAILDIGCGWGSLSLWIAERYPRTKITAVSNSSSQGEFILKQAKERGLSNVTVYTADMNYFVPTSQFDRVVSVEAFEHMRNYKELFRRIRSWLKPEGKLFVHIFCHKELAYPFETEGADNWMGRNFFTGGIMPSDDLFRNFEQDLSIQQQWRWNGLHYARTLRAWLERVDSRKEESIKVLAGVYGEAEAERWFYRWRIFFHACAELFAYRNGNEWRVSHYLFSQNESEEHREQSPH